MEKCCLKKTAGLVGGGFMAALFALLSFALFSCSNMSGGGSSSSKNSYPVVRFVANMQSDLATAPQEISGLVSASAGTESFCDDGISRSAMPNITIDSEADAGVKYYVEAVTGTEGKDSYIRHFVYGNSSTLELGLESGKTWSVTCGIGEIGPEDSEDPNSKKIVLTNYMSDNDPSVTITPDEPVYVKTFGLKPTTDGSGNVYLEMTVPDSAVVKTFCSESALAKTLTVSSNTATLSATEVKSGIYDVTFIVYQHDDASGNDLPVYCSVQTINVFDNMTTRVWRPDGGAISDTGAFIVDSAAIESFKQSVFYVGSTGLGLAPADTNSGTPFEPLATMDAAFARINLNANAREYTIFVCGTVEGYGASISLDSSNAKSLLITGYGETQAVLDGKVGATPIWFGSVLDITSTGVPVAIKNVKVTGGNTVYDEDLYVGGDGGGININGDSSSEFRIDGCLITGNKAQSGAGVAVYGAKLKITNTTISSNIADIVNNQGCGGGLCATGDAEVTIGTGCLIQENKARSGGGVYVESASIKMTAGAISKNTAKNVNNAGNGGGIYFGESFDASFTGGTISENTAEGSGGGMYVSDCTVASEISVTGGTIEKNTASQKGGAIYALPHAFESEPLCFYLGGSASVPAGSSKTNDICLDKNSFFQAKIYLKSALSKHSKDNPIVLNVDYDAAKRGTVLVEAVNLSSLENYKDCFELNSDDWNLKLSSDKKSLVLDAPIWVAGEDAQQCTGTPSENGPGKKAQPFDTIEHACAAMTDPNVDYTILIDGTLSGNQTISTASAKSITICGASSLPTTGDDAGIPQDKIDAGGTMDDEYFDTKSALNIEAAVSVTIKNLMITGGRREQGGGIHLSVNGAALTLSSGAYVTKNKAKNHGGGVFVGQGCSLTIEDGAVIKGNKAINTTLASGASCAGGGVYVFKNSTLTMTGGTICENSAATGGVGGGVYCGQNVDFLMYGGKICKNSAIQGSTGASGTGKGGGVYCYKSNFTMTGGVIGDDSTSTTATSTTDCSNYVDYIISAYHQQGGGGIYYESSDNSKEMKLLGGTIARNYSSNHGGGVCVSAGKVTVKNTISYNRANEGGGVYNAGAFAMTGGKIYGNSAGKGNGIMVSKFNGQEAQLEIQGCAYLPPDNVICLGDGTSVKITGALTPTDTGASGGAVTCSTATITPTDYDSAILTAADGINLEDWIGYFVITPRNGDAALIDGLEYGVGVDGKFDTSRILVTKSSNEVRDALYELTKNASGTVNICFATDFKPTTVLSETLDPESSGASGVQYHGLLKFYEGVTVNLSATKPVVIGESYSDYGSVIVTKKTNLAIGPNIKLVGNRKAHVLYQRGGNVTLNGCEITGSYGSTYAGLMVYASTEYGQALATINEDTEIHGNSGSGIRLQKSSDSLNCPDAILIMNGGDIYANGGNSEYNAGVAVYYGKVTKTGGRIYGNFGWTDQGPNKPSQVYFIGNGYWWNDSSNSYVKYEDKIRWTSEQ